MGQGKSKSKKQQEMIQLKNRDVQEDYCLHQIIGKGHNATVYRASLKKGGLNRAIKMIKKTDESDGLSSHFVNQAFTLKSLDHPNISKCFDVYQSSKNYYIVTEYLSGGKLFDRILQRSDLNETDMCVYFYEILKIIRYIHSNKIMHRDIKPDNLIFSDKGNTPCLKIIDFQSSCEFSDSDLTDRPRVGTPHFMAPEVIAKKYNQKCDLWSAGVILFIMLSGQPPFNGISEQQILFKISSTKFSLDKPKWQNISSQAKNLIAKLLDTNPITRLSSEQAMKHDWFKRRKQRSEGKTSYLRDTLTNMKKFQSMRKMQQGILIFMVNFLSSNAQRDSLMKAFRMMDVDGDGRISLQELKLGYQNVQGFTPSKAQKTAQKIFNEVDKNKSGFIDYKFLISSMNLSTSLTQAKLQSAFEILDQDNDGALSVDQFKKLLGPNIPISIYSQIVNQFDENKNGLISKQQFVAMMTSVSSKVQK